MGALLIGLLGSVLSSAIGSAGNKRQTPEKPPPPPVTYQGMGRQAPLGGASSLSDPGSRLMAQDQSIQSSAMDRFKAKLGV